MGFYDDRILPHVINLAMRNRELLPYRERVLFSARGRVLEIGIGSGLNLPLYGMQVEEILGLDPLTRLITIAQGAAERSKIPVTFIAGSAEAIPIDGTASIRSLRHGRYARYQMPSGRFARCVACSNQAVSYCSSSMGLHRRKAFGSGKIGRHRSGRGLAGVAT